MANQTRRSPDQQRITEASRRFGEKIRCRFEELASRLKHVFMDTGKLTGMASEATHMSSMADAASRTAIADVVAVSEAARGLSDAVTKMSAQVVHSTGITREAVGEAQGVSRTISG